MVDRKKTLYGSACESNCIFVASSEMRKCRHSIIEGGRSLKYAAELLNFANALPAPPAAADGRQISVEVKTERDMQTVRKRDWELEQNKIELFRTVV